MIHDDNWTFTSMDTEIGCPIFYTWDLKSFHYSYNIHTYFPIIASNVTVSGGPTQIWMNVLPPPFWADLKKIHSDFRKF